MIITQSKNIVSASKTAGAWS